MQKNVDQASQPVITAKNASNPGPWLTLKGLLAVQRYHSKVKLIEYCHLPPHSIFKITDLRNAYVLCVPHWDGFTSIKCILFILHLPPQFDAYWMLLCTIETHYPHQLQHLTTS